MTLKGLVFAGMGTLAECADLDRQAWNAAFRTHGLRWNWSWDTYAELMRPGGHRHLATRFADYLGVDVAAEKLDRTHIRGFAARLVGRVPLRPGVAEILLWAAQSDVKIALVSRASAAPLHALLAATARERGGIEFDAIVAREDDLRPAPHPDAVAEGANRLGARPKTTVVIADTPAAAAAALDAGMATIAWPGQLAEDQVFPQGAHVVGAVAPATIVAAQNAFGQKAAG